MHAPHGALPCLHKPLPRFGRHVIVASAVPALRPPILDNGGRIWWRCRFLVFARMRHWARQLVLSWTCFVRPEKLFRVAVRCFFPRLPQFSPLLWLKERRRRCAAWNELFLNYCFAASGCSVFNKVGFYGCRPEDEICEVNPSGWLWARDCHGEPWKTLSMCMM